MKRVVVVASGLTERVALPHLVRHMPGVLIDDVRFPPGHRDLTADQAAAIVVGTWFEKVGRGVRLDKFVVLKDADGRDPAAVVDAMEADLRPRVRQLPVPVLVTAAKWHLEAWFFADEPGLRAYLGRALGAVDTSAPDSIPNPKLHLKNLLGDRVYTAGVAEEIAQAINGAVLNRSPSFSSLERSLRNGPNSQ